MKQLQKSIVKIARKHQAMSFLAWLDVLAFNYSSDVVACLPELRKSALLRRCDQIANNIGSSACSEFPIVPTAGGPLYDDAFGSAADAFQAALLKLPRLQRWDSITQLIGDLCHTAAQAGVGTLADLAAQARKHLRTNMAEAMSAARH